MDDQDETPDIPNFDGGWGYYYNPPTLVDNHIYIGTSSRSHEPPSDNNAFYKIDSDLQKVWEYSLGSNEVRGAAALDSQGNVYFVVEKGRESGDFSGEPCGRRE